MSTEMVEKEILEFLSTDDPEVLCLSGRWGVGKTFAWNKYAQHASRANLIAFGRYAYVSLFGIGSLDELKYSIFQNTIQASQIGIEPSLDTLRSNTGATAEKLGRKSIWFFEHLPLVKNYVAGLGPVWFLSVSKTIICLDDIERRGKTLDVRDVMGLVSQLKEQKRCKVALILNDEALDQDKQDFDRYYEKVVDKSLKFAPTPDNCVSIALTDHVGTNKFLADDCVELGISNIRVIAKIARSVRKIEPLVRDFDEQVLIEAVKSLTLLGWSVFEPDRAPQLEYLKKRNLAIPLGPEKKNIPPDEAAWNALLNAYGFIAIDEFDLALLDGIRVGFFDRAQIQKLGAERDSKIKASKRDNSFEQAWSLFYDSFQNNQDEVLDRVYDAFVKTVQNRSAIDLSGAVTVFKEFGRRAQARTMIESYLTTHGNNRRAFDLNSSLFRRNIDDPDVIRAFKDKFASFKDERVPAEVLRTIARAQGWCLEDLSMLAALSADDYYKMFKENSGSDLRAIIEACLRFDTIINAPPPAKEISRLAKEALRRIGKESAINARRVRVCGVTVDDEPTTTPSPPN